MDTDRRGFLGALVAAIPTPWFLRRRKPTITFRGYTATVSNIRRLTDKEIEIIASAASAAQAYFAIAAFRGMVERTNRATADLSKG